MKQLDAVDPATKRLGIAWVVAGFVGAPDVCDLAELLRSSRDLLLVKPFFLKVRFDASDESFNVE